MIATHEPQMPSHARTVAASVSRDSTQGEIQLLYGVRTDRQSGSVAAGEPMRVYIPFGSDWYGYFMRRLAGRPAKVAFLLRALRQK